VASAKLAQPVARLQPTWAVNALAQAAGQAALKDHAFVRRTRDFVRAARDSLVEALRGTPGIAVFPGVANFLLLRLDCPGWSVSRLEAELARGGFLIRNASNFWGLDDRYWRIAVRRPEENERFVAAVRQLLTGPPSQTSHHDALRNRVQTTEGGGDGFDGLVRQGRNLRPLMVLGASSHAGKSLLVAGLGRLFAARGYRVAPFKAQNMSLNSFVTREGCEIARAQAVQAEACQVEPHTDMNPILLKPMRDGCQVIVQGRPLGRMETLEYYHRRPELWPRVTAAYDRLRSRFELILLEGAGSPVEVNLRETDLVNMAMAEYADARVILVADIERGGVFAQIVGTWELLDPCERDRVIGFVINKFRGTRTLLDSGLDFLERRTGRPVLGVLPYDESIRVEEEDSLGVPGSMGAERGEIDVLVVRLPGMSNFTDFWALARVPRVRVRFVARWEDWGSPDLVILPGTRTTVADLRWLERSGLKEPVCDTVRRPSAPIVLGICGGFQMLGRTIEDPGGVESDVPWMAGLNMLDARTVFASEKSLHQVRGNFCEDTPLGSLCVELVGYEVHMGQTLRGPSARPLLSLRRIDSGEPLLDGAIDASGRVWGTYVHGLLDAPPVAEQIVEWLRRRRGLPPLGEHDAGSHREFLSARYGRLAAFLQEHMRLEPVLAALTDAL
jgi:adenosylcobyric acid synthase